MKAEPLCAYCQKPGKLHRDHVVPRSRGGPDNANNIVMSCQSCNSAKGDQLPSEWLVDRCPASVLLIEARVNAKLKTVFGRRDKGKSEPKPDLFAFTTNEAGRIEYVGRVVSESEKSIRLEPVNCLLLFAGMWDLSGELVDVPRERCRIFTDRDACLEALGKASAREDRAERV